MRRNLSFIGELVAAAPAIFVMSETRVCTKCGVEKNILSDFRNRNACRACEKVQRTLFKQTPEYKAKRKKWRSSPAQKEKARALKQKPEYKEKARAYKIEYRKTEAHKEYMKAYKKTDAQREYMREYRRGPEYKAYMQTNEYKERAKANKQTESYKAYANSIEYKEKCKERKRRPDQKEKAKALKQKPEYMARQKKYDQEFGGSHYRRAINRGNYAERVKRIDVFKRDKFICEYCQKKLTLNECVLDHRIPIVKGGSNTLENCTTSCNPCNSRKNDKIINGVQISIFDKIKI